MMHSLNLFWKNYDMLDSLVKTTDRTLNKWDYMLLFTLELLCAYKADMNKYSIIHGMLVHLKLSHYWYTLLDTYVHCNPEHA